MLAIFSGYSLSQLVNRLKLRNVVYVLLIAVVISSFLVVKEVRAERTSSIALELREYAYNNIEDEAIVIFDPRIYWGIYSWALSDKHFFEGDEGYYNFIELVQDKNSKKIT